MLDVSQEVISTSVIPNVVVRGQCSFGQHSGLEVKELGGCGEKDTCNDPRENVGNLDEQHASDFVDIVSPIFEIQLGDISSVPGNDEVEYHNETLNCLFHQIVAFRFEEER